MKYRVRYFVDFAKNRRIKQLFDSRIETRFDRALEFYRVDYGAKCFVVDETSIYDENRFLANRKKSSKPRINRINEKRKTRGLIA